MPNQQGPLGVLDAYLNRAITLKSFDTLHLEVQQQSKKIVLPRTNFEEQITISV